MCLECHRDCLEETVTVHHDLTAIVLLVVSMAAILCGNGILLTLHEISLLFL